MSDEDLDGKKKRFLQPMALSLPTAGSSSNSNNATGSGRNKVALKPGYGLMGWVRFAADAKDLSGIEGDSAANKSRRIITVDELAKHDQMDDCWISIRGKVYNITPYVDYHPGGVDELMRGAGKNATQLFEEVHSWVNYENLLEKCYIGKLAGYDPL